MVFGCCRVVFCCGLLWNWEIEIREHRDPPSRATSQSAVGESAMNVSLEMQGPQSQAQLETLNNHGAAQVAKTTYGARDFQTNASTKIKRFKGDEAGLEVQVPCRTFDVFPSSGRDPGLG